MGDFNVNSGFLYGLTGFVILFVIAQSVYFLLKAAGQAKKIGLSGATIRRTIMASVIFTIGPAVAILLGVITLSKMLGLPLPWLRLSVLGAVTYELPAATTTAKAMGLDLATRITDPKAFSAIAWVMTLGIIPGIFLVLFGLKKIEGGYGKITSKDQAWGKIFMDCLFLGMISAFMGMLFADIRQGLPGFIPIVVALVSAAIMAVCGLLLKRFKWLEQFALPISMLGAMILSIPITALMS